MNQTQLEFVQATFDRFVTIKPVVQLIDDQIVLDGGSLSIRQTSIEEKSIRGIVKVPGYALDVAKVRHGQAGLPDDVDVSEYYVARVFGEIVVKAIALWVEQLARNYHYEVALANDFDETQRLEGTWVVPF